MHKQAAAVELQHPNILINQGAPDGSEGAEGETLARYLARVGRLPAVQGQALAAQLLSALAYAHGHGVVHGAIDAEHLLVSRTGQLKLTGFPPASPRPDAQADLQAAALVIYELLTGRPPFAGKTGRTPAPPVRLARAELPVELDQVFCRALAPTATGRFADAGEFSTALQAALGAPLWERPAEAAPRSPEAPRPERRHAPEAVVTPPGPTALPALPGARASAVELALAAACLVVIAWTASVFARPPSPPAPAPYMAQADSAEPQPDPREEDVVRGTIGALPMSMSMSRSLVPPVGAAASRPAEMPLEPVPAAPQGEPEPPSQGQLRTGEPAAEDDAVSSRGSRLKVRPAQQQQQPQPQHREPTVRVARRATPAAASLDCRQDLRLARDMCMAFRCATADYREHPVCVRMHAEQQRRRDVLAGTYGMP